MEDTKEQKVIHEERPSKIQRIENNEIQMHTIKNNENQNDAIDNSVLTTQDNDNGDTNDDDDDDDMFNYDDENDNDDTSDSTVNSNIQQQQQQPSLLEDDTSHDNSKHTIDATSFLFQPPVSKEEANHVSQIIIQRIDEAQSIISQHGYKYYKHSQIKSSSSSTTTTTLSDDHTEDQTNNEENQGMDTDDEERADCKTREQVAALQEAVIRGNPRRYQTALFELAKRQNTIINLGTGQGKTLIALLCIKHFSYAYHQIHESTGRQGYQTLFLVPSVALAQQHTTTLMANLPFTVGTACNNSTKSVMTREEMTKVNIIVATHGAARDMFMHYGDMFSFERINLLIIDECHYATGEHGYASIMKNFYHRLPKDKRPRVIGLTASPLVNVKRDIDDVKLGSLLEELENRLDARIACLTRLGYEDNETNNFGYNDGGASSKNMDFVTHQAEERSIHYYNDDPVVRLPSHEHIGLHETRIKEFNQLNELYNDLGPKLTSFYSATVARELSRNKYDQESADEFRRAVEHLQRISNFCQELCKNCPSGGRTEKLAVLEQLLEYIFDNGAEDTVGVVFVDRRITALALYDYFRNRKRGLKAGKWLQVKDTVWNRRPPEQVDENTFRIEKLFAKERVRYDISSTKFEHKGELDIDEMGDHIIRNILEEAIPEGINPQQLMSIDAGLEPKVVNHDLEAASCGKMEIKCNVLVRHATQIFKYLERSYHDTEGKNLSTKIDWLHKTKHIKSVLDGLRSKRTNVLIATSVVEEGVDVDACSFVIVFDHLKSTKAYIQMKGRARQKHAKFYVFQDMAPTANNPYISLQLAQRLDNRVRQFIESRDLPFISVDPVFNFYQYNGPSVCDEELALSTGQYRTPTGMVDLSSAKSLLNRYSLTIPVDKSSFSIKELMDLRMPQFEDDRLLLPSHIPSDTRCIILPECYRNRSRKDKMMLLSLMACVRLHKLSLLNDRLLPLKKKDMQNKLLSIALTKLAVSGKAPEHKCPTKPGDKNKVFVYRLNQSGDGFSQNDDVLKGNGRALCIMTLVPLPLPVPVLNFHHEEIGDIMCSIKEPRVLDMDYVEWIECAHFYAALMNARWRRRSRTAFFRYSVEKSNVSHLPPYIVGCLTKDGNLDWSRMRKILEDFGRSEKERIDAVRSRSLEHDMSEPRIWCPSYDPMVSYISYGPSALCSDAKFPSEKDDVKTYQDYFTILKEFPIGAKSRLFAVQRLWHLPRKMNRDFVDDDLFEKWMSKTADIDIEVPNDVLREGERSPCEGLTAGLLPQEACMEAPVADASLFLHSLILPQFLYHVEHIITTTLFLKHCHEHLPRLGHYLLSASLDEMLEVMTAKSCIMPYNYDRYEWLGDAVLKIIHTDALLYSRDLHKWVKYLHEGDLTLLRSAMGSNNRLTNACQSAGINRFVLFKQLGRGQWTAGGLELHDIDENGDEIISKVEEVRAGKKTDADFVEAILGLIYLKHGFSASFEVANELGITLPRNDDPIQTLFNYTPKVELLAPSKKFLGKGQFNYPELIEEAFTHPSCVHEEVPCYQKLEWVGDAALCIFTREWMFKEFPKLKVSDLNILESAVVCNETLAYLNVANGLQRYINHRDPTFPTRIEEFEASMAGKGSLWGTDPPKCLSDVVEALFGAVHVDDGFDSGQNAVRHAMQPILHSLHSVLSNKELDEIKNLARGLMHPKQYVHEIAGGMITVKSWKEDAFALRRRICPVWSGKKGEWVKPALDGLESIAVVEAAGIELVSIIESTAHLSRNIACALVMEIFRDRSDLVEKLKNISAMIIKEQNEKEEVINTEEEKDPSTSLQVYNDNEVKMQEHEDEDERSTDISLLSNGQEVASQTIEPDE